MKAYKYYGLKKKSLECDDQPQEPDIKKSSHETPQQTKLELQHTVKELEQQLFYAKKTNENLEHQLDETTLHAQHQIMVLLEQLDQSHQQNLVLQNQLEHKHNQLTSVQWDRVQDDLDVELVSLRHAKGILSSGPIDQSDKRSLTADFTFGAIRDQLASTAPNLSSLIFAIGRYSYDVDSKMTVKDIQSLSALCILAKKDSGHVKGFQVLVGLMLLARATSKQVITDLNHLGFVCHTERYFDALKTRLQQLRQVMSYNMEHG